MSKILNNELKEGIVSKIQDDLVIGGLDQQDAAYNYALVIYKLKLTNLKVQPAKHIFPKSCDIARCNWRKGGFLEYSPYRKNSLLNTKEEHITKVRHIRSLIGLQKTLHIATPAISRVLAPLEKAVAEMQQHQLLTWYHSPSFLTIGCKVSNFQFNYLVQLQEPVLYYYYQTRTSTVQADRPNKNHSSVSFFWNYCAVIIFFQLYVTQTYQNQSMIKFSNNSYLVEELYMNQ